MRFPEKDEFVIATVKKIFPYGAFCTLEEYDNAEAFIHVSQVASRWVKNIHEFLKEGQKIVAKVQRVIPEKMQIDISLSGVSETDKKRKVESYRKEKRAEKLLEQAAKKLGKSKEEAWKEAGEPLAEAFGDLYSALENISLDKASLGKVNLSKGWADAISEIASDNIKSKEVSVSGTLTLACPGESGIDAIKSALQYAVREGGSVLYLGAPHYLLSVQAPDYKSAEKRLESVASTILAKMKEHGGKGVFDRSAKKIA